MAKPITTPAHEAKEPPALEREEHRTGRELAGTPKGKRMIARFAAQKRSKRGGRRG